MKQTQRQQVEAILKQDGKISNFYAINNRITIRLSDIIMKLRRDGWEIETTYNPHDETECIYTVKGRPTRKVYESVYIPETNSVKLVVKEIEI